MFTDWLERRRLIRKGLACDKTRLKHSEDSLQSRAESAAGRCGSFVLGFSLHCCIWAWRGASDRQGLLEDQILAFIVFISGLMLLELDCPEVWRSNSKLLILGWGLVQPCSGKGLFLYWPCR